MIYVCLHILHPHRKNYVKELSIVLLTDPLLTCRCRSIYFQLSALKNFNFLDCLGLIDALSANERAEIIACILLVYQLLGTSKSLKRSEKLESKRRRLKEALLYYKRNVNHCHRPYGPTRDHSYVDTLVCRDDCKQSTHYHIKICCFQN